MKPVLVLYATREGQTRRIAEHVAATLRARGFDAKTQDVRDTGQPIDLSEFGAAILGASVHAGKHEREMVNFVKTHREELERIPNAFLSVSLAEAGAEQQTASTERRDHAQSEVKRMVDEFFQATGWQAKRVKPVAGALLYTKYGFLKRFIMRRISASEGGDTDTSKDHEYTDWEALDRFVEELATSLEPTAGASRGEAPRAEVAP